jgi:Ankyrin repeats (3 copies)
MTDRNAQSIEEIFPLIDYCRQGKLEEARVWAEAGKPLNPPPNTRRDTRRVPLLIAISRGFYSMAKLLVQNGADPHCQTNALAYAIGESQTEIVRFLIESKAIELKSVSFASVCAHGNPDIIRIFLEAGADIREGEPIYSGLMSSPLAMARIAKEMREAHPEIQGQLDRALCDQVQEASGKVIGMLLWAGAQAHVKLEDLDSPGELGPSAVELAVFRGDLAILKQMHPFRHAELIPEMIGWIYQKDEKLLDYILSSGALINDKPNGGSTLVDRAFWSMYSPWRNDELGMADWIRVLGSRGAKWVPNESDSIKHARQRFKNVSGDLAFSFIKQLFISGVAKLEDIRELIRTPKMKDMLGGGRLRDLDLVFDPPKPKRQEPETPPKKKLPKFTVAEMQQIARNWVIDQLCENREVRFWTERLESCIYPRDLRKLFGLDESSKVDAIRLLEAATEWVQAKVKGIEIRGNRNGDGFELTLTLSGAAEWKDALTKVWPLKGQANTDNLSSAAVKLLAWVTEPDKASKPIGEASLSFKLGLNGRHGQIESLIREIEAKAGVCIVSHKEGGWGQKGGQTYQFSIQNRIKSIGDPCLDLSYGSEVHTQRALNLREHRSTILKAIVKVQPKSGSAVCLFRASSKKEVQKVFPGFVPDRWNPAERIRDFFIKLKLPPVLRLFYDFRSEAPAWFAAVTPKTTWKEAIRDIREMLTRPSAGERWQLGIQAAVLTDAILEARPSNSDSRWVVDFSTTMAKEAGINDGFLDADFLTRMTILGEEITEMTPLRVTAHPLSKHYNLGERVCLHCREKTSFPAEAVGLLGGSSRGK